MLWDGSIFDVDDQRLAECVGALVVKDLKAETFEDIADLAAVHPPDCRSSSFAHCFLSLRRGPRLSPGASDLLIIGRQVIHSVKDIVVFTLLSGIREVFVHHCRRNFARGKVIRERNLAPNDDLGL